MVASADRYPDTADCTFSNLKHIRAKLEPYYLPKRRGIIRPAASHHEPVQRPIPQLAGA